VSSISVPADDTVSVVETKATAAASLLVDVDDDTAVSAIEPIRIRDDRSTVAVSDVAPNITARETPMDVTEMVPPETRMFELRYTRMLPAGLNKSPAPVTDVVVTVTETALEDIDSVA